MRALTTLGRALPVARAAVAPRAAPRLAHAAGIILGARRYTTPTPHVDYEAELNRVIDKARSNAAAGKKAPVGECDTLKMLMFGKPGAGKGTLSGRLVKMYDIAFISTGDVLRHQIAQKSDVGKKAEKIVASGGLVSDELMLELVMTELEQYKGKSFILDGFPRTLEQGKMLHSALTKQGRPINLIVNLNVPDSIILSRIQARWVHLPSGRVYNDDFNPPKVVGKDDVTGEPLSKRPDDTVEVFSKRLGSFYKATAPLLEYFAEEYPDALHSITGDTSDELWPMLKGIVDPPLLGRPFKLHKRELTHVLDEADDLRDGEHIPLPDGKVANVH